MKFTRDRRAPPPAGIWLFLHLLLDLSAQAVGIVFFGAGCWFALNMQSVWPFVAGLVAMVPGFWLVERVFPERRKSGGAEDQA